MTQSFSTFSSFENSAEMQMKNSKANKKSKFSQEEDSKLINLVNQFGDNNWNIIALHMDGRNVRQCRERWRHYLSPSVSNAPWTMMEDYLLDQKYAEYGPKWKKIAEFFPNRTDINIKNRFLLKQRHMERLTSQIAELSAEYQAKFKDSKKNHDKEKNEFLKFNTNFFSGKKQKSNMTNTKSSTKNGSQIQTQLPESQEEVENFVDPFDFLFTEADSALFDLNDDLNFMHIAE